VFSAVFSGTVNVDKSNYSNNNGICQIKVKKTSKAPWSQLFTKVRNTEQNIVKNKHHKNWDNISKELDRDLKDDKEEGDGLMNMFKEIYSRGNEETRKAMIKSFQTSGGTCLSTNWNEVPEKDYEKDIEAPKGQEVKKWKDL